MLYHMFVFLTQQLSDAYSTTLILFTSETISSKLNKPASPRVSSSSSVAPSRSIRQTPAPCQSAQKPVFNGDYINLLYKTVAKYKFSNSILFTVVRYILILQP